MPGGAADRGWPSNRESPPSDESMHAHGLVPLFTSAHCASTPFLILTYPNLLYSTLTYPRCGAG